MNGSITGHVATFVSTTRTIPAEAREAGRKSIVDTIGVLLAGIDEPVVGIVADLAAPGPVTLLGLGRTASASDAALVNAAAAHAIDYDDVHSHVRGHPSACVLPAALAAVELVGGSGAELLDAYLIGIEVMCGIGRGIGPVHAARGFHATSTLGVLGAAAAAARALGLDVEQTVAALGIAASCAGGLRRNFGTGTKPLHAGHAARDGLTAALLARAGLDAAPDILDPPQSFVETYSPDGDPTAVRGLGESWAIVAPGMAIKKYPCCNRGHRAADAILALVTELDATPDEVAGIEVGMPAGQVDARGRVGPMTYPNPRTGLEAKFSLQYVLASAVLDRALPIAAFTDAAVRRPEVAALRERVRVRNRADADDHVEVTLTLRDGRASTRSVRFTRGDPRGGQPLGWPEIEAKFADCAPRAPVGVIDLVRRLDELPDLRELTGALAR